MAMQTISTRKPAAAAPDPIAFFAQVPVCSYCGTQMRVTAIAIMAQHQDATYECFACGTQVHRSSIDRQG